MQIIQEIRNATRTKMLIGDKETNESRNDGNEKYTEKNKKRKIIN